MHGISASMAEIQFSNNKSIYPVTSFVYSLSQSYKFKAIQFLNVTLPAQEYYHEFKVTTTNFISLFICYPSWT